VRRRRAATGSSSVPRGQPRRETVEEVRYHEVVNISARVPEARVRST
jgi:hypothetical protein